MSNTTWRKAATATHIFILFVYLVGGVFLTGFTAYLFGVTTDTVLSLNWVQLLRPPILVCLIAIWLPLPIGIALARRLRDKEQYGGSLLVSLLTPLVSLLLLGVGVILILLPLGR